MAALSMADGFSRLTGRAQAVIVHVDVGTQGLGPAVHNASCGRAPVLIFAGSSPYSLEGEMRGSRDEFQHWLQDIPDQGQIVSRYCRYTGEIKSGKNIKQVVKRALQLANSDPQGPVYLCAARETMEEEINPYSTISMNAVGPSALPDRAIDQIASDLVEAMDPLVIVGNIGRFPPATEALVELADLIGGMHVLDAGGSDMSFPANHPASLGTRYGVHEEIQTAKTILVLDCSVPWIPTRCKPCESAKIYHIDADPLKENMSLFWINSLGTYRADSATALRQLIDFIKANTHLNEILSSTDFDKFRTLRQTAHRHRQKATEDIAGAPSKENSPLSAPYLVSQVRKSCPPDAIWVVEAVTLTGIVSDHISATLSHSWINCGSSGLGWSGGAALGIKLASNNQLGQDSKFVCQIVGDGAYMFTMPAAVYWISNRYQLPMLSIVLNNGGWAAPRRSLLMVHPDGAGRDATADELNISFQPTPDYAGIAKAAASGNLWAGRASTVSQLSEMLPKAIQSVSQGIGAVLEAQLSD